MGDREKLNLISEVSWLLPCASAEETNYCDVRELVEGIYHQNYVFLSVSLLATNYSIAERDIYNDAKFRTIIL